MRAAPLQAAALEIEGMPPADAPLLLRRLGCGEALLRLRR